MQAPRILIVEDESVVAEDLRNSVQNFGYQVSAVMADGEEAVRYCRRTPPDLVMMDIMLGGRIDGIEAAELIHSRHDVPVVYLTAYADEKVLERAKNTKPCGYLLKPVAKAELRATIEMALHRHRLEKEIRIELEERVRERTAELERTNEVLLLQIAEREQTEARLRESEKRYRTIIENIEEGYYEVDLQGNLIFCNDAMAKALGYPKSELMGKNNRDYMAKAAAKEVYRTFNTVYATGEAASTPLFEYLRRDGSRRIAETSVSLIRDSSGKPTGFRGIVRDVTERKRAEEDRLRLVTAVEQAAETIVITDTDGRIVYVNPAFEMTTGYSRDEALGMKGNAFDSENLGREFSRQIWDTVNSGAVWSGHLVNKRKDGSSYEEEATISPIKDETGVIVNYVVVKRDVTEQVILEKQLQEAQKMEAIGRLAGGIAHDFNNLLQIILGYADLLLIDIDDDDPHHEDIESIYQTTKRAADLVQRILTFSRRVETVRRPIDLNRSVTDAQKLLRRIVPKMIDIEILLDKDLKKVNADPGQLEQILFNLAVNAKDAMPEGGVFAIETQNVNLNGQYCRSHIGVEPGQYVRLRISDNGQGMRGDELEHIFEPFYTTKKPGEGTGLGLALVFGIVKGHGGHITCRSEPGVGTTFNIYFPATDVEATPALETTVEMPAFGTETVLLVDDEAHIRAWGERVLANAGYKVITASNGQQALEAYEQRSGEIHLVVLDLIMPGISGKRCLEKLLEIDPDVRILVASGHFHENPGWSATDAGAKAAIRKPYHANVMLRAVRQALDQP